jgi:hypothetical protein
VRFAKRTQVDHTPTGPEPRPAQGRPHTKADNTPAWSVVSSVDANSKIDRPTQHQSNLEFYTPLLIRKCLKGWMRRGEPQASHWFSAKNVALGAFPHFRFLNNKPGQLAVPKMGRNLRLKQPFLASASGRFSTPRHGATSRDDCAMVDKIHHSPCIHFTAPPKFNYFNTKNVRCPKILLF